MGSLDLLQDIDNSFNINCHTIGVPHDCQKIMSKYNVKVLHVNIRSQQKNFDNFLVVYARLGIEFDAIAFSECWINDNSIIKQINGYTAYHSKKYINKCGGVIIYVNNKWSVIDTELPLEEANCIMVEIPGYFSLLGIYRSPSFKDLEPFFSSLEAVKQDIKKRNCLIVTGDMNIDILDSAIDSGRAEEYLNLMAEFGLTSCIDKPTHVKTCLDHIFVPSNSRGESIMYTCDLTDHEMIMVGLYSSVREPSANDRFRLKIDEKAIVEELEQVDWSEVCSSESVSEVVCSFTNVIQDTISRHSKYLKLSRSKFTIQPWMTPGLIRCSKHRDKLHLESRKNPKDPVKKLIYTRYRNFYHELLRKLKIQYESNEIEMNSSCPKKLWKTIKKHCYSKSKNNVSSELLTVKNTTEDSLDHINDYLSTVGEKLANNILSEANETQESITSKMFLPNTPAYSLFLRPTDSQEVLTLIKNLKTDSAPGLDNINNRLLKEIAHVVAEPLASIFNMSISVGIFPDQWKTAAVIPIHKGGSKDNPGNYRPISLLGAFSKLFERVVSKRLIDYLESNNLLTPHQYGFRRGKSTEDAVTCLTKLVVNHLDNGLKCIGVFLDLAKAFDTVSIPILLKKMEAMGIRGVALSWFTSYLTNRNQCVKIGNDISSPRPVSFGVPQGSILGPTLFLIYLNDIANIPGLNADIICYADDTALIFTEKTSQSVLHAVECGMTKVTQWLSANLLTLNIMKTKLLLFHKTKASSCSEIESIRVHKTHCNQTDTCHCNSIERTSTIKYLGVVLDDKLTFESHAIALAKRVRKMIYVMKNLRDITDSRILRMVYLALCQSVISYCILAWGGAATSVLILVERAQRAVLKVAIKKPRRYPTISVYKDTQVLSVRKLYLLRLSMYTHKQVISSPRYSHMLNQRVFKLNAFKVNTSFAQRFLSFLSPLIYNKIEKVCDIKKCTLSEMKRKTQNYLMVRTYDEIENMLKVIS